MKLSQITLLLVIYFCVPYTAFFSHTRQLNCLSSRNLRSLAVSLRRVDNQIESVSGKCECFPSSSPAEGWTVTCHEENISPTSVKKQLNDPIAKAIRVNGLKDPLSSIDTVHYNLNGESNSALRLLSTTSQIDGFTMKNENNKVLEIACSTLSPDFKPAMLQGKCTNELYKFVNYMNNLLLFFSLFLFSL